MTEPPIEAPPAPVEQVPAMGRFALGLVVATVGFFAFITGGALIQLLSVPFGVWFTEVFIFFAVPFIALRLSGRDAWQTPGLRRPWLAGLAFGFALGVANFFAAAMPLMYLGQQLVPEAWLEIFDTSAIFRDKSTLELAFIVGAVCLAAPLCEEYFFRGVLQPGVQAVTNPARAVVLTGLWFSFCHLDPIGFLARWELGIVFGLLAWRTGSLWPGIMGHLANNLTSSVLFLATRSLPQEPEGNELEQLALIAGMGGVALLLVLLAGRRWPQALIAPEPASERLQPAPGVPRAISPWAAAAVLSLGLLAAADGRGVSVNFIDSLTPIKAPKTDADEHEKERWENLREQRKRTLAGEETLGEYWSERKQRSAVYRR